MNGHDFFIPLLLFARFVKMIIAIVMALISVTLRISYSLYLSHFGLVCKWLNIIYFYRRIDFILKKRN